MAASDELRFRVRGTGGHGAMRKQLKDPVAAGAELLTRLIALNGECVLSIGRVEAGGATNIVPDEIYMEERCARSTNASVASSTAASRSSPRTSTPGTA